MLPAWFAVTQQAIDVIDPSFFYTGCGGGLQKKCIQVDTWVHVAQAVFRRHQRCLDADGSHLGRRLSLQTSRVTRIHWGLLVGSQGGLAEADVPPPPRLAALHTFGHTGGQDACCPPQNVPFPCDTHSREPDSFP